MARQRLISRMKHFCSYYVPAIAKPFAAWLFGSSETSAVWNFRTAALVILARAFFNDPTPVSMLEVQKASTQAPKATDSTRRREDTMIPPEANNVVEVVTQAINSLSTTNLDIPHVELAPVRGEWLGYQLSDTVPLAKSNADQYGRQIYLCTARPSDPLLVYLHGGQFHLRNAASRRPLVQELVQRSGGIAFSMSYRLSPQRPFPAALVDLLIVYLSLVYPIKNSRHVAFPATSICICGDSSGANIAAAFLQLVLELQRKAVNGVATVHWNGKNVPIPYPRAIIGHSGYMELTRSLPSEMLNLNFDLIPSPRLPPVPRSQYIQDEIWPPTPPRHHVYAPTSLLTHPLVSPVTAPDWRSCPTKVLLSVGQECLADGNILLAKTMAAQGVDVILEMYEGMPHDFLMLLQSTPGGKECLDRWAAVARMPWVQQDANTQRPKGSPSAFVRSSKGFWREVDIFQMQPHRTRKELILGMEAMITQWGAPWRQSDG